jgi:transcriptional regulator with XRE-family HTH domain
MWVCQKKGWMKSMFDMRKVGQIIGDLRKKADMTQMELADRLSISYQAVSNWERGQSMPDISKLPELAGILGVNVDTLLGESPKSGLLQSVLEDRMEAYLEDHQVSGEEVAELAPILKPRQTEQAAARLMKESSLEDLAELAPYLSRETLDQLASVAAAAGDTNGIEELAPFLSRDVLSVIATNMAERGEDVEELLPFLDQAVVDRLLLERAGGGRGSRGNGPLRQ